MDKEAAFIEADRKLAVAVTQGELEQTISEDTSLEAGRFLPSYMIGSNTQK